MPKINVLPKSIAELIAAGEVVERPASIVKEAIENSIDAGATHITVEIQRGGITYIRITDNGCGISGVDVPKAFLRHATSKIEKAVDLDSIMTLGFRGEALAATSAVSRVELFTKTYDEELGTHYKIEGGEEVLYEEVGCPDGTTLIVRDLFYNTPARMKFLKKDVTEGTTVAAVVERQALSHPEIAFKLIRDGKQTLSTSGDGKLASAAYSVLGREISNTLIPVNLTLDGVTVTGLVCKPVSCRASRAYQFTFLNGRYVQSGTVTAASEQAYKNSAMVGKFPVFILCVSVPFETVDVNVHPAKTQVRFSDEKRVFTAVYNAVKNAILSGDTRPEITITPQKKNTFLHMTADEYRQTAVNLPTQQTNKQTATTVKQEPIKPKTEPTRLKSDNTPFFLRDEFKPNIPVKKVEVDIIKEEPVKEILKEEPVKQEVKQEEKEYSPKEEIKLIGEAFNTFIAVQKGESIFLIDKHAAHERILFNNLKATHKIETQTLLIPISVKLIGDEYSAVVNNLSLLAEYGFEVEDFGNESVMVRAIPAMLSKDDVESVIVEAAESLAKMGKVDLERIDDILHTVACKAAIKAGYITSDTEKLNLAIKVLSDNDIMYCPHGRPVAFEIKKYNLEKYFGRIQ
ncbi:MAG: DNA mismatch repair endonuclease MutL [Clostridia bacterium]|nr:DNA mismatch repair endonuclease MutL [Clostridia bacterium]